MSIDPTQILTYESARDLAGDLLRQLVEHHGDEEAVSEVLMHWADVIGFHDLALIATVALHRAFAECMAEPSIPAPSGAVEFRPATKGADA